MIFFAMVIEAVVHSVYKVMTPSCFSVIQQHKVSGGKQTFHHCVTSSHMNLGW